MPTDPSNHKQRNVILQPFRWLGVAFILFGYFFTQTLRHIFLPKRWGLALAPKVSRFWGAPLSRLFGIRIVHIGNKPKGTGYVVVSNHVSWLDPITMTPEIDGLVFITSEETRRQVFVGQVTAVAGCQFVSRSAWTLKKEIDVIRENATHGITLGFYPEATSTDGREVKTFKPAFFEVPMQANLRIQPVCLRWTHLNGEPLTRQNADVLFYYGDMTFFASLRRVMAMRSAVMELDWLPPLQPSDYSDRKALANAAYEAISNRYIAPI